MDVYGLFSSSLGEGVLPLAFIGMPGIPEMLVIGVIAVLLFGKRLPEVARSVGKSYNEFKRGLRDMQSGIDSAMDPYSSGSTSSYSSSQSNDDYDDLDEPTAPKFEPPTDEPSESSSEQSS